MITPQQGRKVREIATPGNSSTKPILPNANQEQRYHPQCRLGNLTPLPCTRQCGAELSSPRVVGQLAANRFAPNDVIRRIELAILVEVAVGKGEDGEVRSHRALARAAANRTWRTLTLNIPGSPEAPTVRIGIDEGNGGQPQRRHTLTLDATTGAVQSYAPFSSQTAGQKARSWIRFLHTGEALGIPGQTVAGAVSLGAAFLVFTGFCLSWRRFFGR